MRVAADISYPTGSPDRVFALAVDKAFRAAVCEATHSLSYSVDIDASPDGRARVTVERTLPADVPDFVKTFVGQTLTIVQTEDWGPPRHDGARTAGLEIRVKGQPATMTGSLSLEPRQRGTQQRISGDLTVSVPFLGRKIEPVVAKAIVAAAAKEQETGRTWLDRME